MNLLIFIYLSKFADELSVGYYNAASQLSSILFLVFQSIVLGAFPVMCQRFLEGVDVFKELSNQVIEILFTISIPLIIGLFFLAQSLMTIGIWKHRILACCCGIAGVITDNDPENLFFSIWA